MPEEQTESTETAKDEGSLTQAPADLDPYFVRDGKAVTGEGEPVDVAEAKTEPEKAPEAKPEKPVKKERTAGETWKEIRAAQKEAKERAQQIAQYQEQLEAERKAFDEERQMMRTNFRGWLKQQNLSLKDIIEEDLREQDVDPVTKKMTELEAYTKKLEAKLEQLVQKDQLASDQLANQQDCDALKAHAANVAEDYPLVSARIEKMAPRMRAAYYAHKEATGQKPTMEQLFSHFEQELVDLGLTAPSPSPSSGATQKPLPPARGKGAGRSAIRAREDPDDVDGDESEGPASLTNRQSAVRASNGRKLTREERLANAASLLTFRS